MSLTTPQSIAWLNGTMLTALLITSRYGAGPRKPRLAGSRNCSHSSKVIAEEILATERHTPKEPWTNLDLPATRCGHGTP